MTRDRLPDDDLRWRALPRPAQLYVSAVIAAGVWALVASFPLTYPRPLLFATLVIAACLTSLWKVNLPIPLRSGSTLSVAYAANLVALLLLGPSHAVLVALSGTWTQCTFRTRQRYPLYRTVFSAATVTITMMATGIVYAALGGPPTPESFSVLGKPLVGAVATCFFVNTGLIAGAIALSTHQTVWRIWHDDFLWGVTSFMVAGTAGAVAAVVIHHGEHWKAVLMLAPIYLMYRTYQLFVGRLEDQKQHLTETRQLHEDAVAALRQAREAERALEHEKERLAETLVQMERLEQIRNQLLEREQVARASAEQANRLKDEFLAMVSHELRTPLNAILGWADMLRRGRLEGDRLDRACRAIYDSARRQSQLIDELLDVARIMSGKLRLDPAAVDASDVVRSALEIVQPAADVKRIQIAIHAEPALGAIYGDGARIQQIVWNLLSNAVKFTPESGIVRVQLHGTDDHVEIVVTDTGPGIPPDFLPFVFEPFRQADGSTTRPHGGLGLGLSIVKHLVDAHGGTVSAQSDGEGRGATFRVRLPVLRSGSPSPDAGADPRTALPGAAVNPSISLEGISVLVVDDDDDSRDVVAAHLEGHQAVVLTAGSAAEAFDILQQTPVDVLLADVAMPVEDGYSLVRRVRSSSTSRIASIPAAALTAFARAEDRKQALAAGFQLHLTKPIDAGSLVSAIASLGRANPT